MAKGYWIARVDVRDPEGYKGYVEAAAPAFREYGATFLARGGAFEALEGTARSRNVVIEFDSVETAKACYHSEQYQKAKAIRQRYAEADMIIVEGYDG
ncbi:MAG TPA: DUF1330 domain-containing protein [Aurantimonas coralicida]|uniref:DUF1330 domain-containing protein n=2 Tax=root TaxID=1 RepID=A0A9C9NJV4_9HYPH|nr:DUF1330 domain-containing protein [Aurantimonas coralicida]HEU03072.1 DUF1330 domain-containing protein [Aurantimonas coralicida]